MAWTVTDPLITPPHITDPDSGDAPLWEAGDENEARTSASETPEESTDDRLDWDKLARDAFLDSTTYIDSNYRQKWNDSLRAFNNEHPADSKYNSETFRKRSRLYVPRVRGVIRKNEAAAAAAFFSNSDTVSIQAMNQGDKAQQLSADLMQQIVQYRLTHTIPWFLVLIGALQDAQVQDACIAHIHWRFIADAKSVKPIEDRPVIDLVPIENIRFHPASDWLDPLHTSPYLIHLIPMYVGDVKERMRRPDPKGQKWKEYDDAVFRQYLDSATDSTRQARLQLAQDPTTARSTISDYDVVWVHRHIHRVQGTDYEWYTLASEKRLTDPQPLKRSVFHGRRPYEMGRAILETHKPLPMSLPELLSGLQEALNDSRNQRSDNVKLVLNKRYIVKRGKDVDTASLIKNVPGSVTLANDPKADIEPMSWPDVTQSAYLEEDRIVGNFDELAGNFNPLQVASQRTPRESERTMLAIQSPSNLLTEYMLKTFVETFVLPVLRQLVLLEQHYETDETVLAIAGEKAKARQKFGVDRVTDDLLDHELTTTVNVGMGATDPVMKLQRFLLAMNALQKFSIRPPPGVSVTEFYKEVLALSGYRDGARFMTGQNPEIVQLQQQFNALKKLYQQKIGDKSQTNVLRLQGQRETNQTRRAIAREGNITKLLTQGREHKHENVLTLAEHIKDLDRARNAALQSPVAPAGEDIPDMQPQVQANGAA